MATSGRGSPAASPQLRLLFPHEKVQEEGFVGHRRKQVRHDDKGFRFHEQKDRITWKSLTTEP